MRENPSINQPVGKGHPPPGFHQELQDPSLSPNSARAWATACPQKCSWPKNTSGLRLVKLTPQSLWRKTWVCLKMEIHGRFSVYPVFMSYVLHHLVHGCHRENDDKPPDFVGRPLYFSGKPICSKHTLPVKMMWSPCQPQSPSCWYWHPLHPPGWGKQPSHKLNNWVDFRDVTRNTSFKASNQWFPANLSFNIQDRPWELFNGWVPQFSTRVITDWCFQRPWTSWFIGDLGIGIPRMVEHSWTINHIWNHQPHQPDYHFFFSLTLHTLQPTG